MSQKELRGLWWNVWLDARDQADGAQRIADKVARLVHEHKLDWICLQEVFRYDFWGDRGDLMKLIESATGWKGIFVQGSQYHYENKKAGLGKNYRDGIATFSRFPINSHHVVKLGPWAPGERYGVDGQRSLLETVLVTPDGNITVGNTHWTRIHRRYRSNRKGEMAVFKEHIAKLKPGKPYVVGGDLNTLPSHPIIRTLNQTLDLHTGTARHTTWTHKGKRRGLIRCNLDHVGTLRSGPLKITEFRLLNRRPSDHSPLLCTFKLQD